MEFLLAAFLAYRNSVRAKLKGKNPILWAFITVGAYFMAWITGFVIVIYNFCKDVVNLNLLSSPDKASRDAAVQQVMQTLSANPLHYFTIELFGLGGFLLVRYIIDRTPDKKEPEIHWMDRMGEQ